MDETQIKSKSKALLGCTFTAFLSNYTLNKYDAASLLVDLDMDEYIDSYDYHDAPSSISAWLGEDSVKTLIAELQQCLINMQELSKSLGDKNDSH